MSLIGSIDVYLWKLGTNTMSASEFRRGFTAKIDVLLEPICGKPRGMTVHPRHMDNPSIVLFLFWQKDSNVIRKKESL